ncbi:MAG: hypothetical protein Q9190_007159 [Brigantiaea leucoxantha]
MQAHSGPSVPGGGGIPVATSRASGDPPGATAAGSGGNEPGVGDPFEAEGNGAHDGRGNSPRVPGSATHEGLADIDRMSGIEYTPKGTNHSGLGGPGDAYDPHQDILQLADRVRQLQLKTDGGFESDLDSIAWRMFRDATPANPIYHIPDRNKAKYREIYRQKDPKVLLFSGDPQDYDMWAMQVIQHFNFLQDMYLDEGEVFPERLKIMKAQNLLPQKQMGQWTTIFQDNDKRPDSELRDFRSYLVYFRARFGRERPMDDLFQNWYKLQQIRAAREFINTVKRDALSLYPPPTPIEISHRIKQGLKDRVRTELLRMGSSVPNPAVNLIAWERRVIDADQISFQITRAGAVNALKAVQYIDEKKGDDGYSSPEEDGGGPQDDDQYSDVEGHLNALKKALHKHREKNKKKIKCYECGEMGHIRPKCPNKKDKPTQDKGKEGSQ